MFLPADSIVGEYVFSSGNTTEGNTTDEIDTIGPLDLCNPGYISLIAALPRAPFAVEV